MIPIAVALRLAVFMALRLLLKGAARLNCF